MERFVIVVSHLDPPLRRRLRADLGTGIDIVLDRRRSAQAIPHADRRSPARAHLVANPWFIACATTCPVSPPSQTPPE